MQCPRCKKVRLRKQVSVFVEADAEDYRLGKRGLRKASVTILGVDWPRERWHCPGCGWLWRADGGDENAHPFGEESRG